MVDGKKNRLHNRLITVSARAKRALVRASQDSLPENFTQPDNTNENNEEIPEEAQEEPKEVGGKRPWNKRPRTFDWKLTTPAPGGPLSIDLLRGYRGHVACDIWEKNVERGCLVIQSRTHAVDLFEFDPKDAWYLLVKSIGLSHLRYCIFSHHNSPLLSAFVERWHPETNSFHLPFGEMTITLHDVSLIMGLPIEGIAVNHPFHHKDNRESLFKSVSDLLHIGLKQVMSDHSHGGIKLPEIREKLLNVENKFGADDIARGYLVSLLVSTLFIDKTTDRVSTLLFPLVSNLISVKSYSWGTATLAFLYRELGKASRADTKQLAGSSTLLEAWIYEHFPMFRPGISSNYLPGEHPRAMKWDAQTPTPKMLGTLQDIRWRLDNMTATEVIWMPYGVDVVENYSLSLYHGCIRYGSVIEPYMPDSVLRQFGFVQTPPMSPIIPNNEYKPAHSYSVEYPEAMMCFWSDPSSHCLSVERLGDFCQNPWDCSSGYLQWYLQCTHPKVQNPDHAPQGYQIKQHPLSAEARLHLIAHYLRPVYPDKRSQMSLEDQYHHFDRAIAIVQEFEKIEISEPQTNQTQNQQK